MVKQIQTPQGARKMGQGVGTSPNGARTSGSGTGERDEIYGVVSVIYHALQGAETYQRYVEDARNADDGELVQFFEKCRTEEIERARQAKLLLLDRLEDEELADEGDSDEESAEDEDD